VRGSEAFLRRALAQRQPTNQYTRLRLKHEEQGRCGGCRRARLHELLSLVGDA
jgi:hypothetical protein